MSAEAALAIQGGFQSPGTIDSDQPAFVNGLIINSTALTPGTWESDHLIPCKPEPL